MRLGVLRERVRSRRSRTALAGVLVLVIAAAIAIVAVATSSSVRVKAQMIAGTPEGRQPVKLDTSLYLPATTPAPAVLLSQGFGGDKSGLDTAARTFAAHGYVALTYSARGFGQSGGLIHFAAPSYEVHDAQLLVSYLAGLKQVKRVDGKPQIAAAGSSYGGGISLLLAAADHRVGAVSADITWNNLSHAFFPNFGASSPGVFKKLWVGLLFGNAFPDPRTGGGANLSDLTPSAISCGRFAPAVCAAYQASAASGTPNAAMRQLMRQASPATVINKIQAPTQLSQGEQDSLFPLSEADANARGIAANGTPVSVVWRPGGHDAGGADSSVTTQALSWFDKVFAGQVKGTQPFRFAEQAGIISAATGEVSQQTLQSGGYPGLTGTPRGSQTVPVTGPPQRISSPAGGAPTVITSIPGLGGLSNRFDTALTLLPGAPGQTAMFTSSKLTKSLLIAGGSSVSLTVTSTANDATLFASLRDLAPDGSSTLPSQLVSPIKLTGMRPGVPRTVNVRLPSFVRNVLPGHRLELSVSSTDFAYNLPQDARTYTIALTGGRAATPAANEASITVPTTSGQAISAGHPIAWLIAGIVVLGLIGGAVGFVIARRRRILKPVPELFDVPVTISSLVKEYAGGYRAVDDVTFRVEPGQVVGLLGPNGAGKTTVLRVLVGLITPTAGIVHVFGQPVVPGAPVLARIGAFIEGPGFLPHLSGRDNLRLYWAATGRPDDEADFTTALEIAGLGASIDRRVKTYSHGMKQRLGIAQAMLGLPELLVLDEPTNGLDPPQIAEMREVLRAYAETGRTVVVSSHLLAEVEQTCTHVVVMHKGKLIAAGSVPEIAGAGGMQLSVDDPEKATIVLEAAGIGSHLVPARRALEDVFLDLIGGEE
ncbi:MAG TPA: ATP-binding cassette domain-containing protein [Jatrophihabitans sp.]|nr:ATP-binding cassette domain-containing protein [Jatrophihabitans sp.]